MLNTPRFGADKPNLSVKKSARRVLVPLFALSAMTACASSFFQITPEDGSARPAAKPAEKPVTKPAEKPPAPPPGNPAEKPVEKVAKKKPGKPREEPKPPAATKPVEKAAEKPAEKAPPVAKPETKKPELVKQTAAKPTTATPPVAPPTARRPEPVVVEPPALEPTPAGSDSAGIARLVHAAALWDAVRLFHPAAVANPAAWDNATVRRLTDIRTANTRRQYADVLQQWLSSLNDELATVQPGDARGDVATGIGGAHEVMAQTQVVVSGTRKSRVVDTTLVLTWPRALWSVDTVGWSSLRTVLGNGLIASQVVMDLRARPYVPNGPVQDSALHTMQRDVAAMLTSFTVVGPSVRTRAYEGWPDERDATSAAGGRVLWRTANPMVVVHGHATPRARRVVLVADATTELAPALMALVSNKQATLVSESALSDRLLVPRVHIAMGDNLQATFRIGELINADGSIGIQPDTIVAPATTQTDSAPVLKAAILVARGKLQVGQAVVRKLADNSHTDANNPAGAAAWNVAHYPIMGARLLAVYKMWATLRTFHAYNDLRDENIDDALSRIIPRVEAATDAYSYAAAMLDFASSSNDAQVRLTSPTLEQHIGAASAPFAARWIEGRAIVTQVAPTDAGRASGLLVGEEISAADGYPMPAYVNEHRRHGAASNDWTRLRNTMDMITRGVPGTTAYRVRDANNRERTANVERSLENTRSPLTSDRVSLATVRDLGSGLGYVDLARATAADVQRTFQQWTGTRALILDARGTVSGSTDGIMPTALHTVLQHTALAPVAVTGKQTLHLASAPCPPGASHGPLTRCFVDRRQYEEVVLSDTSRRYRGRVVVLIDERTEGTMEHFAMAMESAFNATLIGSASAGAAGNISAFRMPGLMTLTFSTSELRRADGGQLQRVGLTPQVEARPTVKGIRTGTDDVLDRAQRWLKEQLDGPAVRRRR